MFQSARPASPRENAVALLSRLAYGMGLRKKYGFRVGEKWNLDGASKLVATFRPQFSSGSVPLFALLTNRSGGLGGSLRRAEDAELIVTAATYSGMIGQSPQTIHFASDSQIENRDKLWNYRDQMPHLSPIELFALAKKCLLQGFLLLDFDYLSFEQSTLEFAEYVVPVFGLLRDKPGMTIGNLDSMTKLEAVAEVVVATDQTSSMLPGLAMVFRHWLEDNSHVGVKGLNIADQRPISPTSLLTSLKPGVLEHVKAIVKSRGLREDNFSRDQLDGSSVVVIGKIEDTILAAWAEHKTTRKGREGLRQAERRVFRS